MPQKGVVWDEPYEGRFLNLDGTQDSRRQPIGGVIIMRNLPSGEDALILHVSARRSRIVVFCHLPPPGQESSFASSSGNMEAWLTPDTVMWTPAEDEFIRRAANERSIAQSTFGMHGTIRIETLIPNPEAGESVKSMDVNLSTDMDLSTNAFEPRAPAAPGRPAVLRGTYEGMWVHPCRLPI